MRPVQGTVSPREPRTEMTTADAYVPDIDSSDDTQQILRLWVVSVRTGKPQQSCRGTTRRGSPPSEQEDREMVHGLFSAVVCDPLGCNRCTEYLLRRSLILSNADTMLKAVGPIGHGVAVPHFCGPSEPSGRESELLQDAVRRSDVRHRKAISARGTGTPLAEIQLLSLWSVHGSLAGQRPSSTGRPFAVALGSRAWRTTGMS